MLKTTGRNEAEVVSRFAPSPTGRMHAGNILTALIIWLDTKSRGGRIVLRIEDLDQDRSKQEYIDALQRDLERLGLFWDEGPYYQSDQTERYQEAFRQLEARGLIYPCFCTRADLHAASAPHFGEKVIYQGTCRNLSSGELSLLKEHKAAMRLVTEDETICFDDSYQGRFCQNLARESGDFVVRRSDGGFAYQFAVVLDDAFQGVNSVVRACDLLDSTPQQIYVQRLFGFEQPRYGHVPLVVAEDERRLSKRHADAGMEALLQRFQTPAALIGHLAYLAGIAQTDEPIEPHELLGCFSLTQIVNQKTIVWH